MTALAEVRRWEWCRLPGNDHERGQFGECLYCRDGHELVDEYLAMENAECRCVGDDMSACWWHGETEGI